MSIRARLCADRDRPASHSAGTKKPGPTQPSLPPRHVARRFRRAYAVMRMWTTVVGCFLLGAFVFAADNLNPESDEAAAPVDAPETTADQQEETLLIRARINLWQELGTLDPFLYGQSIPRSGAALDGGLWAEMLDDRKFFRPPASAGSPWHRLGTEIGWSLTYDIERPYTGRGSVKITVTHRAQDEVHGIEQRQLTLVDGQLYAGHVTVAGRGSIKAILRWGERAGDRDLVTIRIGQEGFGRYPIRFRAGGSTDAGVLSIGLETTGSIWIGAVSLMPADHIDGLRPDTIALLRELNTPVYRWPSGTSVTGYDWRDGIGPRDQRPPRQNPDRPESESNDFGIDEFLSLCRILGAEPVVVVDTGLGSPELAAALVQYCNGSARTIYGRRRAVNGRPEPYHVKWWGVGGGTPGDGQAQPMALEDRLARHQEFVRAMRAIDNTIRIVAAGGAAESWSGQILEQSGDTLDILNEPVAQYLPSTLASPGDAIPASIRTIAEAHRSYLATIPFLRDRPIPIALDAWNHPLSPDTDQDPSVGSSLRDSLAIARGLHEIIRHPALFRMAHYAPTTNSIGAVQASSTTSTLAATALPLHLYRNRFGVRALQVEGQTDPLDIAAAITSDRRHATIGVVNPNARAVNLQLDVRGAVLGRSATRYLITLSDPPASNQPAQDPAAAIQEIVMADFDPDRINTPPRSVSLLVVPIDP